MKEVFLKGIVIVAAFFAAWTLVSAAGSPATEHKDVLATVNGEPITVADFHRELAALHEGTAEPQMKRARENPSELLDRIITLRLILQEAVSIGLDELPEVQRELKAYQGRTVKSLLAGRIVAEIEPREVAVDREYRDVLQEHKITSALLQSEDTARELKRQIEEGGDFSTAASAMAEDGLAEVNTAEHYLKLIDLVPRAREAVRRMLPGDVSDPIEIGGRFLVVKLEDVRLPDDPEERRKAERKVLQTQRATALKQYSGDLMDRFAVVDEDLLAGLDFETEGGFEKLSRDERPLATIEGEQPLTVKELAAALEEKFFHGVERAVREKKVNRRKNSMLNDLLVERVITHEAERLKISETEDFLAMESEFRNSLLFNTFVKRVIDPGIEVDQGELESFLQEHIEAYTVPELIRFDGLVFATREDAESALVKLRSGADYEWTRDNARGQVEVGEDNLIAKHKGRRVTVEALPEDARNAVTGAVAGDFRFSLDESGLFHVLRVLEVVPATPLPLAKVRSHVAPRVRSEKRTAAIEEWVGKLKAASTIEIFAADEDWQRVLDPGPVRKSGRTPTPAGES